jgi:hypothetical protein
VSRCPVSYLIVNSTDVKRCIAAGVLSIDVRPVEQEMFQMVHHPVPTRLEIKIKAIKPIKPIKFLLLFVLHCNENLIYVFPEKELRGLGPNLHFHVSVSALHVYIPRIYPHIFLQQNRQTHSSMGSPILGIYKSLTDT